MPRKPSRRRFRALSDLFLPQYRRETTSGCWEWIGRVDQYGYGNFKWKKKEVRVHRVSYELSRGEVLGEKHALHHCDNPPCFRPEHLFSGTQGENVADARSKGRMGAGITGHGAGSSGTIGVVWVKGRNRWRVLRYESGRQVTYGEFSELADALERNAQLSKERGELH